MPNAIVAAQAFSSSAGSSRDVAGRLLEREFEDFQRNVEGLADLVDRRAAAGEIGDHRLRHRWRKRRNALGGDAVVAGENRDQRRFDMRRAAPCQAASHSAISSRRPSEPAGLVKFASRARTAASAAASGLGHRADEGADIVEGTRRGIHGGHLSCDA